MSDARKRKRARDAALGTIQDEARFIAEQVRSGDLPENAVRLAAILGDGATLLVYPRPEWDQWKRWDRKQGTREADCRLPHHTHTLQYSLCSVIGFLGMPPWWNGGIPVETIRSAYLLALSRLEEAVEESDLEFDDVGRAFWDRQIDRIRRAEVVGNFSYVFHLFQDTWLGLDGENAVDEEFHRQRQDLINLLLGRI